MIRHDSFRHQLSHPNRRCRFGGAWEIQGLDAGAGRLQRQQHCLGGILCGPLDAPAEAIARHIFPNPEPFLPADAVLAARLFNQTGRRSRRLADCMIASVAIRCRAKLATINTVDFQPFLPYGLILA
jgi:hypothetical protein